MELQLRSERTTIESGRPLLMGILNVGLDSVADGRVLANTAARVAYGLQLVDEGAHIVDVGAISGRTDTPALSETEEIALVRPVVAELTSAGIPVSVDTWRPRVVEAVLEAGAALINDVSGLADPAVARLTGETGAGLVIMHTRAAPKEEWFPGYDDPMAEVLAFLRDRIDEARSLGVLDQQIIVDPGLDYSKTPQESVDVLRRLDELQSLRRPVLLAVSRKYFIGMITGRPPEQRLAGTIAAINFGLGKGANILRVHDVADVAEFLDLTLTLPAVENVTMRGDLADEGLKWIPPKHYRDDQAGGDRLSYEIAYLLDTTLEAGQAVLDADGYGYYDVEELLVRLRLLGRTASDAAPSEIVAKALVQARGAEDWPVHWDDELRDLDQAWRRRALH